VKRRDFIRAAVVWPAAAAQAPSRLVVLCYNIRHGMGMDGRIHLERTAAVIRSASPDVVALQEVDRRTERSGAAIDQAEELGRLTGLKAVFGRAIDYQGGQYGIAVLSRLPVLGSAVHPLPGEEPRALLEVRLKARSQEIVFFSTHLDATRPEDHRKAAGEQIVKIARTRGKTPAILAGDLNTVPERATLPVLTEAWTIAGGPQERPTVPVENPKRQIDWILFRPADRWRTVEVRVLDEKMASDHRPILAVLELNSC
jgi:endonuclease/exonuclease/phosphatase family metal-dependent hydrolase